MKAGRGPDSPQLATPKNVSFVRAMRVVGRDPFRSGLLEKSKD